MAQPNDVIIHGKYYEVHVITNQLSNNQYSDFLLQFSPDLVLTNLLEHPELRNSKDDEWEMGLIKCSFWNTMPNIMAALGNNTLTFTIAGVPHTITLQDGNYTYQSINDELNYWFSANSVATNSIAFTPHLPTSHLVIIMKPTFAIDFTLAGNVGIAAVLGFTGQTISNATGVIQTYRSLAEPEFNRFGLTRTLVETIQIRVDAINHRVYSNGHNSVNALQQDILYEFGINSTPSTLQVERASVEHFVKMRQSNVIKNIRIRFTNQDGIVLPLNKEASVQLQLRRNMESRVQPVGRPVPRNP